MKTLVPFEKINDEQLFFLRFYIFESEYVSYYHKTFRVFITEAREKTELDYGWKVKISCLTF